MAIGMAANAGALSQAALASELAALEVTQKEAVQEQFPQERAAWVVFSCVFNSFKCFGEPDVVRRRSKGCGLYRRKSKSA